MAVLVRCNLSVGRRVCGSGVINKLVLRRLLWPALTTAIMLAITVGLGVWQLQRLAWKTALLAAISQGEASPATPLPANPEPFHRYIVTGRFAANQARYGVDVRQSAAGPVMGEQVIGALLRPGQSTLMIDRGWAPDDAIAMPPPGIVAVSGYLRLPEYTPWMGAKDDPLTLHFYALDPKAIAASLGFVGVAPFTLVVIGPAGEQPEPVQSMPQPPNDHLSYAVTWFSLSGALVVVFIAYVRQAIGSKGRNDRL